MCAIEAVSRAFGGLVVLFEDTKLDGKKYDDLQTSKNFDTRSRYNQTFRNAPDKFLIHVRCSKIQ